MTQPLDLSVFKVFKSKPRDLVDGLSGQSRDNIYDHKVFGGYFVMPTTSHSRKAREHQVSQKEVYILPNWHIPLAFQDIPFYSRLPYLLRSGDPFLFPLFHYSFISTIVSISLILCWYHRYWLRPDCSRCACHRASRCRRLLPRRLPRRALLVYKSGLVPSASVATELV